MTSSRPVNLFPTSVQRLCVFPSHSPTRNAPTREPCPCKRCNGALVSRRTVNRHHRAAFPAARARSPIPTFDEWWAATQAQLARSEHTVDDTVTSDSTLAQESPHSEAGGGDAEERRKRSQMDESHKGDEKRDAINAHSARARAQSIMST